MAKQPTHPDARPDNRALVYGLGNTGLSVARYLKRAGIEADYVDSRAAPPGLDDLKQLLPQANVVPGNEAYELLPSVGRIIVSPGIADSDALLQAARESDIDVVSDIDLFVAASKIPFAAITGSNGKSTVATLLAMMCEAGGMHAMAGANLGEPALDLLTRRNLDFCVLELSSFQLQRCRHLPARVAVLLNISPDHLDWHSDEQEYRDAKYRIFSEASSAVWNRADAEAEQRLPPSGRLLSFGLDAPPPEHYGIVENGGLDFLARGDQLLMPASHLALVGKHNQANALAALAAGELLGLDISAMLPVLYEFAGLPHRMQSVRLVGGVEYINDSKATNVGAAISAVESIDAPVVLIAGGQGKGGDFDVLAEALQKRLRAAVLIGEDAPLIAAALSGSNPVEQAADMQDAVTRASTIAEPGDVVLLAPACASFDQFLNFQARGDSFRQAVEELGK